MSEEVIISLTVTRSSALNLSSASSAAASDLSELEQAELSARRLKLEFEKRKISEKINNLLTTVSAFDSALVNLLR